MDSDKTYFAVATNTLVDGIVYTWVNHLGIPRLFPTKDDAWKCVADSMIDGLRDFIRGDRTLEETDFNCDDDVIEVRIVGNKILPVENGIIKDFVLPEKTSIKDITIEPFNSEEEEKEFFWQDKSGRGFTNTWSMQMLRDASISMDENDDEDSLEMWGENAEVGDTFETHTDIVTRIK